MHRLMHFLYQNFLETSEYKPFTFFAIHNVRKIIYIEIFKI
jgi:hypothetical protein